MYSLAAADSNVLSTLKPLIHGVQVTISDVNCRHLLQDKRMATVSITSGVVANKQHAAHGMLAAGV